MQPSVARREKRAKSNHTQLVTWKQDHYRLTSCENALYILRFSLDRNFASVDTAHPDSGDVEAPHGPSRGTSKIRVIPQSGPGFKRKKSSAKYLLRARIWRSTCCKAECEPPANGSALAFCAVFPVRLPGSRLFFARTFHRAHESSCSCFDSKPEQSAAPLARAEE